MARLADPVVGAEAQAADALGDRGRSGADDDGEVRQADADALELLERARPEQRRVDDDRAEAHRDERVDRRRAAEDPVLPAKALHALAEHLQEPGVGVDDGDAQSERRRVTSCRSWCGSLDVLRDDASPVLRALRRFGYFWVINQMP